MSKRGNEFQELEAFGEYCVVLCFLLFLQESVHVSISLYCIQQWVTTNWVVRYRKQRKSTPQMRRNVVHVLLELRQTDVFSNRRTRKDYTVLTSTMISTERKTVDFIFWHWRTDRLCNGLYLIVQWCSYKSKRICSLFDCVYLTSNTRESADLWSPFFSLLLWSH